jgi:hypothetical protein
MHLFSTFMFGHIPGVKTKIIVILVFGAGFFDIHPLNILVHRLFASASILLVHFLI